MKTMNDRKLPNTQHESHREDSIFDLIVIGAGVTGLATAMYAGTEMSIGGTITLTEIVENYPGFDRTSGPELAQHLTHHAQRYSEHVAIREEKVVDAVLVCERPCFMVKTETNQYAAKALIFATGTRWRKLEMKGAAEFENRGVQYCALCDAPLYRDKAVAIIGGSDTAAKEALLLARYAKKVYIIYRGEKLRAEPINAKRVAEEPKIEVIYHASVREIKGGKVVERIVLDKKHNGSREIEVDGVFGAIGNAPLSGLAEKLGVKTNQKKEIIIDHRTAATNVPGVFAAGDVTDKAFKQAVTGVAEGVLAAYSAYKYVNEKDFVCIFYDEQYG
mgnify:CR=1 FL=1